MEDVPGPLDREARISARRQRMKERLGAKVGDGEGAPKVRACSCWSVPHSISCRCSSNLRVLTDGIGGSGKQYEEESRSQGQISDSRTRINKLKVRALLAHGM